MIRIGWLATAPLVLLGLFQIPGAASAGPVWDWFCGCDKDCPPPTYSCIHYWGPTVSRIHDCLHGPKINVYAPDRHPEITPTIMILKFPCPPVVPEVTLFPIPTAPATSRFLYLDRGIIGGINTTGSESNASGQKGDTKR
jgi:hypothetical protein